MVRFDPAGGRRLVHPFSAFQTVSSVVYL